jgi:hypothetical protein
MCNILIYFCDINIKHLQHTSETSEHLKHTLETYIFSIMSPCCLDELRLVVSWSLMPVRRLTPAQSEGAAVRRVQYPQQATPTLEKATEGGRVQFARRGAPALEKGHRGRGLGVAGRS